MLSLSLDLKDDLEFTKININTDKVKCVVANHLLNVCRSSATKFQYLQVQLIEMVSVQNYNNIYKFW